MNAKIREEEEHILQVPQQISTLQPSKETTPEQKDISHRTAVYGQTTMERRKSVKRKKEKKLYIDCNIFFTPIILAPPRAEGGTEVSKCS